MSKFATPVRPQRPPFCGARNRAVSLPRLWSVPHHSGVTTEPTDALEARTHTRIFLRNRSSISASRPDYAAYQRLLLRMFLGHKRPVCLDAADANDDGIVDICLEPALSHLVPPTSKEPNNGKSLW